MAPTCPAPASVRNSGIVRDRAGSGAPSGTGRGGSPAPPDSQPPCGRRFPLNSLLGPIQEREVLGIGCESNAFGHALTHSLESPGERRAVMAIQVAKINETMFKVTVGGRTTTTHTVTVSLDYYEKLTGGRVTADELVEKSFEFLLERESNTSILSTFDLPVIQRYFPEYERTITAALA